MTKPLVFSDLDDTLFQTARKMSPPPEKTDVPVTHALNGSHSFMTPAQTTMFNWLNEVTRLIPVTARPMDAMARCTLKFRDYQILSNGAVILNSSGGVIQDWMNRTGEISNRLSRYLFRFRDFVSDCNGENRFRHWIVHEYECDIYYCVKSNGSEIWLDDIQASLIDLSEGLFTVHRNGNNLSLTPRENFQARGGGISDQYTGQGGYSGLGHG